MFKSIEYKLYLYISLLIIAVAAATYLIIKEQYIYGGTCIFIALFSTIQLYNNYNKFNKNILFLLNALDNGDYSFNFSTIKLSRREKELNKMMNRIKEILSKAKTETIEGEKFLSHIITNVPTGIIILDDKNNVKEVNKATNHLLGLSVFTHLNQLSVLDENYPSLFRELRVEDGNKQIKISNDKEEVQISLSTSNITIGNNELRIITLNSIGNELEAKEMESWVKLIRVMTHEIMNSIAPITSLTEMLLFMYQHEDANSVENLKENTIDSLSTINITAKGLTSFVESYRQFSRVSNPEINSVKLEPLIQSILKLEAAEIEAKNILIDFNIDNKELSIDADQSQISQVLINLVKNAIEALSSVEDKKIKITVDSKSGEKVKINIANNGAAIPAEVVENIFIPFFTTKQTGTGIGLSVSRYIMRLHGGNLKHSYANGWTIFTLTI